MPAFDDLITANAAYAQTFAYADVPGRAGARLGLVTCMDSRIDPLAALGLSVGDVKIVRNPGGQVTDEAVTAMVLAVQLLGAERLMVLQHTRCAMASAPEADLRRRLGDAAGTDASWLRLGAIPDQADAIREGVARLRSHPLIGADIEVGGFIYDVDTGLISPVD